MRQKIDTLNGLLLQKDLPLWEEAGIITNLEPITAKPLSVRYRKTSSTAPIKNDLRIEFTEFTLTSLAGY